MSSGTMQNGWPNNYVKIWKEMVKVDPNVKYIIGGDLWQG